ncbi:MAG: sigma factor [Planctomycetaceae bacterium]
MCISGRDSADGEAEKSAGRRCSGCLPEVFFAISQAISQWEPHPDHPFRAWLGRIARNAILNAVSRRPKDQATGLGEVDLLLTVHALGMMAKAHGGWCRRLAANCFIALSQMVRCEFTDITWRMFWETEWKVDPSKPSLQTVDENDRRGLRGSVSNHEEAE